MQNFDRIIIQKPAIRIQVLGTDNAVLQQKKAIYKNVKQVISIHRQSKKRQYHACFYNSTS